MGCQVLGPHHLWQTGCAALNMIWSISAPLREEWDAPPLHQQGWGCTARLGSGTTWVPDPQQGLGTAVGQEGGKEVGEAMFMCMLGVGEQEEGQETGSQPFPQLPFPPISAGQPHRQPGGPRFLSHLDRGGGSAGMEGRDSTVHLRGGCGRSPPDPLQRQAAGRVHSA